MRRMVVVGIVGGVGVTAAFVVLRSRRAVVAPDTEALTGPARATDWAPLRLVPPLPDSTYAITAPFVAAADDGSCPASHPVKAKLSSGIFHDPSSRFYATTKAQRCYLDAEAATADGLRPPKR